MRLLLDESVPRRLRNALPAHSVKTAVEMGWGGIKNGALLALAAPEFDAFITVDKNLPYQQNVAALPIAVVLLTRIPTSFRFFCLSCRGWSGTTMPCSALQPESWSRS
jgi:hypothetical protein